MTKAPALKLIILDFDGTTGDTLEDVVWCMGKTFELHCKPKPDRNAVLKTVGLTLEDSFRALDEGIAENDIKEWVGEYRSYYQKEGGSRTTLYPEMKEALLAARDCKIDVLVVSNKGIVALKSAFEKMGIADLIGNVLSGETSKHKKPSEKLYQEEIKTLYPHVSDKEVLVVGDTRVDLEFANNAGLMSCWAAYGYGKREECLALSPTFTINAASELKELVLQFRQGRPLVFKPANEARNG